MASLTGYDPVIINMNCPHCRRDGALHGIGISDMAWRQPATDEEEKRGTQTTFYVGIRKCPNPQCNGPVFVVKKAHQLYRSYPPEVITFDGSDVPQKVRSCIEEAILCHSAGCYRAAALMVRRTLEEMCEDRQVKGGTLKERIDGLKSHIVIPEEFFDGAHELRFLGNDAAHVEAKVYQAVGSEEVALAIDVAKELLRATYQAASLVNRLKALKAPKP